ncbi:hypothetical protein M9H77_11018 [Catharanthus roseus]|uniref:Uncharacterized protein n=1 Tax=Catharanthus roseus TaxID=4058 RepID=A0ACC0BDB7_CATRO|nr:hypothetical protein M9H77_11018 [Catharanthus roseus]
MQRKILFPFKCKQRVISIRFRCDLLLRRRLNCSTTFCCSPPEESVDTEQKSKPELLEFMSKISSIPTASGNEFSLLLVQEGPTEFGPIDKDPVSCWSKSTSRDGLGVCSPRDRHVRDPYNGHRLLRWACCWAEPWSC